VGGGKGWPHSRLVAWSCSRTGCGLVIGVLVSGSGTNLQALIDAGMPIAAVASNVPGVCALKRAAAADIATGVFELESYPTRSGRDAAMATWLSEYGARLIVCAGYMHLLTGTFLDRYPERVINVHPSLLPAFPGMHAVEQALEAGVAATGVTVHYVDSGIDTGQVIEQVELPIQSGETVDELLERVHQLEHRLLPQVARRLLEQAAGTGR